MCDATSKSILEASAKVPTDASRTERIYSMDNRQAITPLHIREVLYGD
jgi:hypothetical protein